MAKDTDKKVFYQKKVCKFMQSTSFVLTKADKDELYEKFEKEYTRRSFDEILSGRRFNERVSDQARILIVYRIGEVHRLTKKYEKVRTEMKQFARKGLL